MLGNGLNYLRAIRFWFSQFPRWPGNLTYTVKLVHDPELSGHMKQAGVSLHAAFKRTDTLMRKHSKEKV